MKYRLKKYRLIIISVILLAAGAISVLYINKNSAYWVEPVKNETIEEIREAKAKKLMIVAHPDDETLWGGIHLLEDDYYVVCITNGNNDVRSREFSKIIKATGNQGIILSYPDKVNGRRDDWSRVYGKITDDMERIINAKNWELIVTHNPDGEYGHMHHVMTDRIVTGLCEEAGRTDKLFYFGRYYKKADLEKIKDGKEPYGEGQVLQKENILKLYKSQKETVDKLSHMNPYEDWISYKEWKNY